MNELGIFYKAFLESLDKSPHTIKQYSIDTQQFLNFMEESHYSFEESINTITQSYNEFLDEKYASAASINRKRSSLHYFLSFLKQRNLIDDIPEDLLKPVQLETKSIQTLSAKQVQLVSNYWFEFFESATDHEYKWIGLRNFCIVNIMLEVGVKPSEIVGLKWSHLKEKEMTIVQNKKFRKLPLSKSILNWLELYQYETEELLPTSKEVYYVWLGLGNKQNEHITVKTIERIFQALSESLGFKVTATIVRYTTIDGEVNKAHEIELQNLYLRYGYSRKSVLKERINRFNQNL